MLLLFISFDLLPMQQKGEVTKYFIIVMTVLIFQVSTLPKGAISCLCDAFTTSWENPTDLSLTVHQLN